jgi:hypothetical protein
MELWIGCRVTVHLTFLGGGVVLWGQYPFDPYLAVLVFMTVTMLCIYMP